MPTLESRRISFRDSIDKRNADLLVGLESNADLKSSLDLLCFVLAHKLTAESIAKHPIVDDPYWITAFEAMKRGCEKVWGPALNVEEEPKNCERILP
jgi:hypothetical protein